MKKIIYGIGALVCSVIISANEVDDLQQKTNIILVKKVILLENKISILNSKIISMDKSLTLLNKKVFPEGSTLEKNDLSLMIVESGRKLKIEKKVKKKVKKKAELKDADFKELYKVIKTSNGYKNKYGTSSSTKQFVEGSYVIIHKNEYFKQGYSKTHTSSWIDSSSVQKVKKSDFKTKGKFYRVDTYMANTRSKPTVYSEIESVLRKNDIIYVVGTKTAKNGGVWKDIQNNGFINNRIIKPLRVY